jgi:sigma-54 dependent transcriptional regulator, acetoin dehydrogenase operon transcriptional activator AcoR
MLFLEPPSRELAGQFLRGETPTGDLPPVIARWERAASLGANVDSDAVPEVVSDADLATRRDRLAEVFREQGALLAPITNDLAARELAAVVADQDGVILVSRGGGMFDDAAARVRLIEGARWSEDVRGTNAIGTALIEKQLVAVLGAAHFERRNHGIFCYAHPILDGYGDLVAVFNITGPMDRHDRAVGLAVRAAASSLEQALRRLAWARSGAGTLSTIEQLVQRASAISLLVEASGDVRVLSESARALLDVHDDVPLSCKRTFGMSAADLCRLAITGSQDLRFETPSAAYRFDLSPLMADGRPFAVVVYLERIDAPRPSVAPAPPASVGPAPHPEFDSILGWDEALVAAKVAASRFATTSLPVLLVAETGTGKELFANAIHRASPRAAGPFIALNCGAMPRGLLESELFGHTPGAFTGASRTGADGKIAAADGGTLFLDEVAEMPDEVQATLLRVLDDGVYYRVGDSRPRRSDFRLVCATCRDLPALVERGSFRRDLFFRIQGAYVTLPPVRDRSDRLALADGLLRRISNKKPGQTLSTSAKQWILKHRWPGNVRELKNALMHAAALADADSIIAEHFPRVLVELNGLEDAESESRTRAEIVSDAVQAALDACDGNVSEAARRLGVARSTVYRVLRSRSAPSK